MSSKVHHRHIQVQTSFLIAVVLWSSWTFSETIIDSRSLPKFLGIVPNVTKTVGRDALLTCNVDQLKGYKVAWVQVDTQTILTIHKQVITRNPRVSLLHDDHRSWHLQIKNLQEDDTGFYMCQVNTDPMRSIKGYLDVVVPPDIIDKESSGDMIVLEGEDVRLRCKARGHPNPKIVWKREKNEDIVLEGERTVKQVEGEELMMSKVSRLQMGSYLCIASNNVPPSISKRIQVKVHFSPVAWVPQQLEGAYIGQELSIECHTEAYPMSINYWTNTNNDMIVSGDRMEATVSKSSYKVYMTLKIKYVTAEDFGTFRCIAKNSLGETDGAIKIYELEAPPTFSPDVLDFNNYDKEFPGNGETRNRTNHIKNHTSKFVPPNTPNDITDTNQRTKDKIKGDHSSNSGNRRSKTFLYELSRAQNSKIWNSATFFLSFVALIVL